MRKLDFNRDEYVVEVPIKHPPRPPNTAHPNSAIPIYDWRANNPNHWVWAEGGDEERETIPTYHRGKREEDKDMSWSVSVPATSEAEFPAAVQASKLTDAYNKPELVEQWSKQLEAAKKAVLSLFESGGFGEGKLTCSAGMSGHANHDGVGEGTGYTSSEFISVTVNCRPSED